MLPADEYGQRGDRIKESYAHHYRLKIGHEVTYALEGSIFVAGSVVQWLRDGPKCIEKSSDVEALAASVPDTDGVYFVPALTGLGAPIGISMHVEPYPASAEAPQPHILHVPLLKE